MSLPRCDVWEDPLAGFEPAKGIRRDREVPWRLGSVVALQTLLEARSLRVLLALNELSQERVEVHIIPKIGLSSHSRRRLWQVLEEQRLLRQQLPGLRGGIRLALEGPREVIVAAEHCVEPTAEAHVAAHGALPEDVSRAVFQQLLMALRQLRCCCKAKRVPLQRQNFRLHLIPGGPFLGLSGLLLSQLLPCTGAAVECGRAMSGLGEDPFVPPEAR
eukprot:RCo031291